MNLSIYTSPGTDQYNRKYPLKITFTNGEEKYGNIVSYLREADGLNTNIHFLVILDFEEWKRNESEIRTERIIFDNNLIQNIELIKDY